MTTTSPQRPFGDGLKQFKRLLPIVILFWIYFFLRAHAIADHLPIFIDEIHHLRRARAVWAFNDLHTSTTPSKFLLYYWLGAFQLPEFPPLWLVRTPVVITSLLGAAGTFALGKTLFSRRVGFAALIIVAVFPFILFYDRLSLTDQLTGSIAVVMTWWSVIVARRPTRRNATILAIIVNLMLAAKILSGPLLLIPFLAVALLGPKPIEFTKPLRDEINRIWGAYRPSIVRATIIIGVVWTTLIVFYQIRRFIDPEIPAIVDGYLYGGITRNIGIDTGEDLDRSQINVNLERVKEVFQYLWSPLLVGLTLVGLAILTWRDWRKTLFLLSGILPLWIFVIFVAGQLNSRYLSVVGHLCAVVIAAGIFAISDEIAKPFPQSPLKNIAWIPVGLLALWVIGFGLPFARTAFDDPIALEIPRRDHREYFANYTGYALPDALNFILTSEPITSGHDVPFAAAIVRVCEFLPYHMPPEKHDGIALECLPTDSEFPQERYDILNAELETYGALYLITEDYQIADEPAFDPTKIDGDLQHLKTFHRPHDGVTVDVYRLSSNSDPIPSN